MSGIETYQCCCDPAIPSRYFALRCDAYYSNYCCTPYCSGAPARIDLCIPYLLSIGVPVPLPAGYCVFLRYQCCVYVVNGPEVGICPNPISGNPQNVGTLASIEPSGGLACCRPWSIPQTPIGGLADVIIAGCGPTIEQSADPCTETVAVCYDYCDQYGLHKDKPVHISATLGMCAFVQGVPWDIRCDHGPPDDVYPIVKIISQRVGPCIEYRTKNGAPWPVVGPIPATCENEHIQRWEEEWACPACFPWADCCGGFNPCDGDPNACDGTLDPRETYTIKSCYRVVDCPEGTSSDLVENVMEFIVDACAVTNAGFNPAIPSELNAWANLYLTLSTVSVPTCWSNQPTIDVPQINICGLKIRIVSGTPQKIVERVGDRIGTLVFAGAVHDPNHGWWFGYRQVCDPCPDAIQTERPPFIEGDTLEIGTVVWEPAHQQVRLSLVGRAKRKYVAWTMSMTSEFNCRGEDQATTIAVISATGDYPYTLECLSVPEVSGGMRYTMQQVETLGSETTICSGSEPAQVVPDCVAAQGWPLEDVVVTIPPAPPVIVQYGWESLKGSLPDPMYGCRCYPWQYMPAPCCPNDYPDCEEWEIANPLPEPCVLSFQSASYFSQTVAMSPHVKLCGP